MKLPVKSIAEVLDFICVVLMASYGLTIWTTIEYAPESPAYRQYCLGAGRVVLLLAVMSTMDYIIHRADPKIK